MFDFLNNRKFMSMLHIVIFGLLIMSHTTYKLSENFQTFIIYLEIALIIYHLFILFSNQSKFGTEGMYEGIDSNDQQIPVAYNLQGENIHHIRMLDSSPGYDVPKLIISAGDVIVWTNAGEIQHTVTSNDDIFHSGYMKPGESFSIKFSHKGTYPYYCMLHKGWMTGVVIVK